MMYIIVCAGVVKKNKGKKKNHKKKKKKKKKKKIDNGYNLTFSSHPSALPYTRFFIKWLFVPVITSAA